MLRYSSWSIFSTMEDSPKLIKPYFNNTLDLTTTKDVLSNLLTKLEPKAVSLGKLFATGVMDDGNAREIQGIV